MLAAGIDIGSRSIELVLLNLRTGQTTPPEVLQERRVPTTFSPVQQIKTILSDIKADIIIGTGYGRKLLENMAQHNSVSPTVSTITEIKAHALGANFLFPQARAVLDIGGQDTKAIALSKSGKVIKFEMNDRCAAGTGKFLEYTSNVFQIPVEEFGTFALQGQDAPLINSMCTVFAETEATSLMAQGITPENIALGLHNSIIKRTTNMLKRISVEKPIVFSGGVANNPCMVSLLCKEMDLESGFSLLIADKPDMTGALGAALWAKNLI